MTPDRAGRDLFVRVGGTKRWVALSSILGIITIGSGIGLLAMAIYLLTRSAALGAAASLSLTILGVRFFAVTRVVSRYCERYLGHLGTFRVLTRLRVWFFEKLVEGDSVALTNQRRGDVVAGLVDDVDTMQDRLLRVSSPPFVAFGTLAIGTATLLAINVRSAAILAAFFLAGAFVLPPIMWSRTRDLAARLLRLRARRLTEITELIDGLETLKIWGRTDRLSETIALLDKQESELTQKLAKIRALLDIAVLALSGLCVLAIVAAITETTTSISTIWWLTATPLIALASFEALGPLLSAPDHRAQTNAAASRILAIADSSSPQVQTPSSEPHLMQDGPTAPDIEVTNLSYSYSDASPIFVDASISIPFGSTVAISAPSGSGKSTFSELLLGLLPSPEGAISIGGHTPSELQGLQRPCIVAVLQDDHVFDTTIRDNLLVGDGDAGDPQLHAVCAVAGLQPFLDARMGGLDAAIGANGDLLSGGERQRLMIARALLADAPILLLDEATEHLEPALRSQLVNSILNARRGRTTIVLAHDADALASVDAVYDIDGGKFVARER